MYSMVSWSTEAVSVCTKIDRSVNKKKKRVSLSNELETVGKLETGVLAFTSRIHICV